MRMQEPLWDEATELLENEPMGQYLLEQTGFRRVLWQLSEGEPPDGALEPAEHWTLAAIVATV
jgi:hypothetical protein